MTVHTQPNKEGGCELPHALTKFNMDKLNAGRIVWFYYSQRSLRQKERQYEKTVFHTSYHILYGKLIMCSVGRQTWMYVKVMRTWRKILGISWWSQKVQTVTWRFTPTLSSLSAMWTFSKQWKLFTVFPRNIASQHLPGLLYWATQCVLYFTYLPRVL